MVLLFVLVGWIFSLCCHEFAHAIVAYWGGDTSVKEKGYLTFNPLKYVNPFMSIILPIVFLLMGGIALPGGAVWIDRARLKSDAWESAVSLAGPAANLILAFVMGIPFLLGIADVDGGGWFWQAWAFLAYLQVWCFLVNLIPIPPLDGFGAIAPYLPANLRTKIYALSFPLMIGLFILIWRFDAVGGRIMMTAVDAVGWLGIPAHAVGQGMGLFGEFLGR